MYKRARNLEFEEAARLRDAIEKMKQQELGLDAPAGLESDKTRRQAPQFITIQSFASPHRQLGSQQTFLLRENSLPNYLRHAAGFREIQRLLTGRLHAESI